MRRLALALVLLALAALPAAAQSDDGARRVATVEAEVIAETSGICVTQDPEVLLLHNDSGDGPFVYAVDTEGRLRARFRLEGTTAVDWEDMARSEEGGGREARPGTIWVGDFGDNEATRDHVLVHRFPEPEIPEPTDDPPTIPVEPETFRVTYPDGAHDAESLLVQPGVRNRPPRLVIIAKGERPNHVFAAPVPEEADETVELVDAGPLRGIRSAYVTAGDAHFTGRAVVVRTYGMAFEWHLERGEDVAAALTEREFDAMVDLPDQEQGESIAYDRPGTGFYTLSEGVGRPLWFVPRD